MDVTYVPLFFNDLDSLFSDKRLEAKAKEACGNVKECLFDVAASGSLSFGNSTKRSVKDYNEQKKDINTGKFLQFTNSFVLRQNSFPISCCMTEQKQIVNHKDNL